MQSAADAEHVTDLGHVLLYEEHVQAAKTPLEHAEDALGARLAHRLESLTEACEPDVGGGRGGFDEAVPLMIAAVDNSMSPYQ